MAEVVGQYRRLVSTCAVQAGAICTLYRISKISPAAKAACGRRQVAMRLKREMREEA